MDDEGDLPALEVRAVRKSFGRVVVLDGVDLVVPRGSITAVLGPSGGGKTTLLRIVAGFDEPDAGEVVLHGRLVASARNSVRPESRHVGVVPQEGALFPHLDVGGNIGFGLPKSRESTARVAEVLELVGLPGMQHARPHQLSGGQQHRVALARALAPRPEIVLLDEPFASLDAGLRVQVRDEVMLALQAARTTAVIVTHDQQEALSMADQVAVLLDGRVAQSADPETLYATPVSLEVATFLGEAIVLVGELGADRRVRCALGTLDVKPGDALPGTVQVVVRPEQVCLRSVTGNVSLDAADAVPGTVLHRSFFGHDAIVRVLLPDSTFVTARGDPGALPGPGDDVVVGVNGAVSVFATPA